MTGIALTVTDLRTIADTLDRLAAAGILLDAPIRCGSYRVEVQAHDSQLDGLSYTVTSIERVDGGR